MTHKTIFVVGGGTGGHLFPAIALGETLSDKGYNVHLVTDKRCEKYIDSNIKLNTHILSLGHMRSGVLAKLSMICRLIYGTFKSLFLIMRHKPSLVIGFGGYTVFPTLLAAKLLCIKIILHEQNCFLGKVNKFFFASASKVALNFAETTNLPNIGQDKIIVSGNPVRKSIRMINPIRSFNDEPFHILVIGGSQGAKIFSSIVPEALRIIKRKLPDIQISITQQANSDDSLELKKIYDSLGVNSVIEQFFYDIPNQYLKSHLAICRAGASTIAELIYLGQPSILIPFPFAAEDHQTFNAKVLVSKGAAISFNQSHIKAEDIANQIIDLITHREKLAKISSSIIDLRKDSTAILSNAIDQLLSESE